MTFDERVRVYEYKLNDTDDQIIEYILNNKEEVATLSIQKLAKRLFTVPNTIVRLSKKLGYKGFAELKLSLKQDKLNYLNQLDISSNILKTCEIINNDLVYKTAKKLYEANKILFYGVGNSTYFCEMMANYLNCVGKNAFYFLHRHDMIYSAENLKSNDVVFAISISGETKQVLDAVKIAKEKGISIISITHLNKNSLSNLAEINLYVWSPKQKINNYDVTDQTPMMIVLRRLIEYYWKYFAKTLKSE